VESKRKKEEAGGNGETKRWDGNLRGGSLRARRGKGEGMWGGTKR